MALCEMCTKKINKNMVEPWRGPIFPLFFLYFGLLQLAKCLTETSCSPASRQLRPELLPLKSAACRVWKRG